MSFADGPAVLAAIPQLVPRIADIAQQSGMGISSCAEMRDLQSFGVAAGACIDGDMIARITGKRCSGKKDPGQRRACRCVKSRDIGAYGTCRFECRYCYATGGCRPGGAALLI